MLTWCNSGIYWVVVNTHQRWQAYNLVDMSLVVIRLISGAWIEAVWNPNNIEKIYFIWWSLNHTIPKSHTKYGPGYLYLGVSKDLKINTLVCICVILYICAFLNYWPYITIRILCYRIKTIIRAMGKFGKHINVNVWSINFGSSVWKHFNFYFGTAMNMWVLFDWICCYKFLKWFKIKEYISQYNGTIHYCYTSGILS